MKKIKPITIDKRRDVNEIISERDLTQLRAQSSLHLQGSTSILSGQVSKATNQTLMDCNKLLKFSKGNSDVGLVKSRTCASFASLMQRSPLGPMAAPRLATSF